MVTISNSINNTVGASNTGVTNTLTITNPSDTASSSAQQLISVGGTSAGDPWVQWSVGSTVSYALGVDNSDSDKFKITTAASATLDPSSGTTLQTISSTGLFHFYPQAAGTTAQLQVSGALGNDFIEIKCENQTVGAIADANIVATTADGGGDPVFKSQVNSGAICVWGIDNSDSDSWKMSNANDHFASAINMKCTTAGEVTFPLTPAFLVKDAGGAGNVTGDATAYTCTMGAPIFDQNSDFATNTFTAPVTGRYLFNADCFFGNIGAAHTHGNLVLVTSNRSIRLAEGNPSTYRTNASVMQFSGSIMTDMDSGDTAHLQLTISNSTKTISYSDTYFSGKLSC